MLPRMRSLKYGEACSRIGFTAVKDTVLPRAGLTDRGAKGADLFNIGGDQWAPKALELRRRRRRILRQKILWSTKFSAGQYLLPAYNFSATIASISSTYHLGLCLPKMFGDWKYLSNYFAKLANPNLIRQLIGHRSSASTTISRIV